FGPRLYQPHPRRDDARPDRFGPLAGACLQLDRARPRHRHDDVEAIEQRAREAIAIARNALGRARALCAGIAARATGAEIHRPDELKARWKAHAPGRTRNEDLSVFERLPQRLERRALELRQLVEEQHALVREARLAGTKLRAAADDRRRRSAVVRRTERRVADERMVGIDQPGDGV